MVVRLKLTIDLRPPTAYEIGNMIRLPAEAAGLYFEQERTTGQRLDEALRDAASATPERASAVVRLRWPGRLGQIKSSIIDSKPNADPAASTG